MSTTLDKIKSKISSKKNIFLDKSVDEIKKILADFTYLKKLGIYVDKNVGEMYQIYAKNMNLTEPEPSLLALNAMRGCAYINITKIKSDEEKGKTKTLTIVQTTENGKQYLKQKSAGVPVADKNRSF